MAVYPAPDLTLQYFNALDFGAKSGVVATAPTNVLNFNNFTANNIVANTTLASGTLGVSGVSSLGAATCTSLTVSGSTTLGATTLGTTGCGALTVSSTATIPTLTVSGTATIPSLTVSTAHGLALHSQTGTGMGSVVQNSYSWGLVSQGSATSTTVASTIETFPATPSGVFFFQIMAKITGVDAAVHYIGTCDPTSVNVYSLALVKSYGSALPVLSFSTNLLQVTTTLPGTVQWSVFQM